MDTDRIILGTKQERAAKGEKPAPYTRRMAFDNLGDLTQEDRKEQAEDIIRDKDFDIEDVINTRHGMARFDSHQTPTRSDGGTMVEATVHLADPIRPAVGQGFDSIILPRALVTELSKRTYERYDDDADPRDIEGHVEDLEADGAEGTRESFTYQELIDGWVEAYGTEWSSRIGADLNWDIYMLTGHDGIVIDDGTHQTAYVFTENALTDPSMPDPAYVDRDYPPTIQEWNEYRNERDFERRIGTPEEFQIGNTMTAKGLDTDAFHEPDRYATIPTNASNGTETGKVRAGLENALNHVMQDLGYKRIPWDGTTMQGEYHLAAGEYAYPVNPIRTDEWGPQIGEVRALSHAAAAAGLKDLHNRHWHHADDGADSYERLRGAGRLQGDMILEAYGLARAPMPLERIDENWRRSAQDFIRERVDPHFDHDIWKDPSVNREIPYGYHDAWMNANDFGTYGETVTDGPRTDETSETGMIPAPDPSDMGQRHDEPASGPTIA